MPSLRPSGPIGDRTDVSPGPADVSPSAVAAHAAEVAGCLAEQVRAVSRYQDGNRHVVYRVGYTEEVARDDVIVRVSLTSERAEVDQAQMEAGVLALVGGRAAPALYDFRVHSPWFEAPVMCMQHVPGAARPLRQVGPGGLQKLGALVAEVHSIPARDLAHLPGAQLSLVSYAEERLEAILSGMGWVRDPLPGQVPERLRTAAQALEQSWKRADTPGFGGDEGLVLLHGDIALGNVLWGPDPVLIDWEYARLGDPADELAYLFDQNEIETAQRRHLWSGYASRGESEHTEDELAQRVDWWEPVTLLGSTLWWVQRWVRSAEADRSGRADPLAPREATYYSTRAVERLARLPV